MVCSYCRLRSSERQGCIKMDFDSKILITGAGFLGRILQAKLLLAGYRNITAVTARDYDLTKWNETSEMYLDNSPHTVFHLAAVVGGIGANRNNPGKFFYENLQMGLNVIEQARNRCVKKILVVGTTCSYARDLQPPFEEEELFINLPEETNAPYGLAKLSLLTMLQAYRQQYNLNGIYLIPANLVGPGDNFNKDSSHVIPAMIAKFVDAVYTEADTVTLWGDGNCSRSFLYVEDCAEALILAMQKYNKSEPVNVGTKEEILIKDLAGIIANEVGFRGNIVWDTSMPNGQPRRCLSTEKAYQEFGFTAKTKLIDAIRATISWYKESIGELPKRLDKYTLTWGDGVVDRLERIVIPGGQN